MELMLENNNQEQKIHKKKPSMLRLNSISSYQFNKENSIKKSS